MSRYVTQQRRELLQFLSARPDRLLSAQEISEALESVSLSAVYRNLAELEAEGKVRRTSKGGVREIYYQYTAAEGCRGCLHLSCTRCGRTFHMALSAAERLTEDVERSEGFSLDLGETVLYGVCRRCRDKAAPERAE